MCIAKLLTGKKKAVTAASAHPMNLCAAKDHYTYGRPDSKKCCFTCKENEEVTSVTHHPSLARSIERFRRQIRHTQVAVPETSAPFQLKAGNQLK